MKADELRASDAERAQVSDLLSEHFGAGRLDASELEDRLGQAMKAKTRGELAALLRDLPAQHASPPVRRHRPWALVWVVLASVIVLNALAWAVPAPHFGFVVLVVVAALLWSRGRRLGRRRTLPSNGEG